MKVESILKKITYNWFPKCLCIGAAIILYLFAKTARLEKRTLSVPLKTIEDGSLVSASGLPAYVTVTIRSESNAITSIQSSDIEAVLDLSYYVNEGVYNAPITLSLGESVILTDPVELTVYPEKYSVKLEERVRRSIPIDVPTSGDPLHGYELKEIKIFPEEAVVSGPRSMVENLKRVSAEEVILSERKESFKEYKNLHVYNKHVQVITPKQVSVSANFQTSLVTKTYSNCKVFFGHLNPKFEVEEIPEINFTVSGAELVVEKYFPSEYTAQVDCHGISMPGEYELPVVIAVPEAFKIEGQSVEKIKFVIKEKTDSFSTIENPGADIIQPEKPKEEKPAQNPVSTTQTVPQITAGEQETENSEGN